MKTTLRTFILIHLVFGCLSISAQEKINLASLSLKEEFTQQTNEWISAYNSKDSKNLLPLYTEDATYISSHVKGLQLDGRMNIVSYFQEGINNGGHIDKIEILSFNFSDSIATLLCKYQATNSGITVIGRNLLVMKKVNGKWLIAVHMTVV
ncbi:MAG: nuclear transport factor 2 family protein [Ignavibacterium album]|uniref:YybH family protein n=1 Tax=Ignavibacterium album TaxID=591197 RepID=UPI0026F03EE2|nr:nuclear transport factor 2 family protein [Ignavibacterium album]MCX8104312.1 nuclear transport factor 2 family protein [Ignavibacterium album]